MKIKEDYTSMIFCIQRGSSLGCVRKIIETMAIIKLAKVIRMIIDFFEKHFFSASHISFGIINF